jgi:hypothetical protein
MNLPYLHVRHIALLDALVAINQDVHQISIEEGCGIDRASDAIANLIHPGATTLVLTPDQLNVSPNPKLFEPLSTEGVFPEGWSSYQLLVQTAYARMKEIWTGNLVKV